MMTMVCVGVRRREEEKRDDDTGKIRIIYSGRVSPKLKGGRKIENGSLPLHD
jgi:hypothetical protein